MNTAASVTRNIKGTLTHQKKRLSGDCRKAATMINYKCLPSFFEEATLETDILVYVARVFGCGL